MKVERASKELPAPIPYSVLRGHDSAVNSIDFVGENHGLISGDVSGSLYYWNMKSLEIIKQWNAHTASVTTIQCINTTSTITYVLSLIVLLASHDHFLSLDQEEKDALNYGTSTQHKRFSLYALTVNIFVMYPRTEEILLSQLIILLR